MHSAINILEIFELIAANLEDHGDLLSMVLVSRAFCHSTSARHLDRHIDTHVANVKAWDHLKKDRAGKLRTLVLKLNTINGAALHEIPKDHGLVYAANGMKRPEHLKLWKEPDQHDSTVCIGQTPVGIHSTNPGFQNVTELGSGYTGVGRKRFPFVKQCLVDLNITALNVPASAAHALVTFLHRNLTLVVIRSHSIR
ncbi:hypothetical protein BD410DRAFT_652670 [Rickenella mellea]|uniref:Uncharacterized protein n=1 Tax=Rickenella mellea TaxID=50990 RepID=A0A4Y7PKS7_9AGAM|nr:hypothetical protein BD410DRAFT_652670 [Rickenella mellea]